MGILFIVFGFLSPFVNVDPVNIETYPISFELDKFFPSDMSVFASLSILLLGVGGAEKIAPYVNRMKKPGKDFPKGIIAVVVMVAISAFAGAIAMSIVFGQDCQEITSDFITNGQYISFKKVGNACGLGNGLMVLYATIKMITDIAVLIVSIDVPLRLLLGNADLRFIPKGSLKQNKHGAYTYWLIVVTVVVLILLLLPTLGIGNTDALIKWVLEINSIVMPIFYLCVFISYIALKVGKKKVEKHKDDFVFIKNKYVAIGVGVWVFLITLIAIIMQMYKDDLFQFVLNTMIPIMLVGLGALIPFATQFYNKKHGIKYEPKEQ